MPEDVLKEINQIGELWAYRHNTFPWISYLIGPSNSAPSAISFETVLLMSGTVNDSMEEYTLCDAILLQICMKH
jgi:hypothetical protein